MRYGSRGEKMITAPTNAMSRADRKVSKHDNTKTFEMANDFIFISIYFEMKSNCNWSQMSLKMKKAMSVNGESNEMRSTKKILINLTKSGAASLNELHASSAAQVSVARCRLRDRSDSSTAIFASLKKRWKRNAHYKSGQANDGKVSGHSAAHPSPLSTGTHFLISFFNKSFKCWTWVFQTGPWEVEWFSDLKQNVQKVTGQLSNISSFVNQIFHSKNYCNLLQVN